MSEPTIFRVREQVDGFSFHTRTRASAVRAFVERAQYLFDRYGDVERHFKIGDCPQVQDLAFEIVEMEVDEFFHPTQVLWFDMDGNLGGDDAEFLKEATDTFTETATTPQCLSSH